MQILLDAVSLVAGIPAARDRRPIHQPAHRSAQRAPARTHRAAAAWHFIRRILTDIRGAVSLHAFEGLRHWRRRGQSIAAIQALDDRILRDIGIDRNTIRESVDAMIQAEAGGRVS